MLHLSYVKKLQNVTNKWKQRRSWLWTWIIIMIIIKKLCGAIVERTRLVHQCAHFAILPFPLLLLPPNWQDRTVQVHHIDGPIPPHSGTDILTAHVCAFKFSQSVVTMSSACCMDVINCGSLRVRNSNCVGSGPYDYCKAKEVRACPSVMSPETKRLLPPNTETVQTKPFPIRGRWTSLSHSFIQLFTWTLRVSFLFSRNILVHCCLITNKLK